jgi:hypothetical protein
MKQPYTCICCGYETIYKTAMNTHFYNKKKHCPRIMNNIELTDEIKQYILNNRIYKIPVVSNITPVINNVTNIINNYNTINNIFFIENMNTIKEFKSVNFENKYKSLEYNNTDLINIINQINDICSGKQIEELNLINLCEDGDLEEMLVEKSIKKIIIILQKYLFDAYEFYLIKNIHTNTDKSYEKTQELKELLQEYYKFIACFGLNPAVKDKSDGYILEDENSYDYELSDIYWSLYKSELYDLKAREIAAIKKNVIDIINRNAIRSIDEMTKKVVELFQVDENFFKN